MKYTNLFLLLVHLSFLACNRTPDATKRDDRVRVTVVRAGFDEIHESVKTSGKLSSKTEVRLSFKTGGLIQEISVGEGESVSRGQVIARLNLSEVNAMENQANLAFMKAKRDFQRVENLYNDSVATLENLQDAKTALEVAEANLEIARFNKKHSVIEAPGRGKILKKLAEENEMAGPGQPVFLFGSSEEEWVVKATVTDRDIVRIALGDSAAIRFDAYPGVTFQSVVTEIGKSADPYTGTYEVELSLLPSTYQLASGFVARLDIRIPKPLQCLEIPVDALIEAQGDVAYIFIVRENMAEKRRIRMKTMDGTICVTEGLEEGERVVTKGSNYLKDNDELVIMEN